MKIIRNTTYVILAIFIPLFILVVATDTTFYSEVICGDEICNHDKVVGSATFNWCPLWNDNYYTNGIHYHESNIHELVYAFLFTVMTVYFIGVIVTYIKHTFPKTYQELSDI
jgi:hypothetical protein